MTKWNLCERLIDDDNNEYVHIHTTFEDQAELREYQAYKKSSSYGFYVSPAEFIKKVDEEDTSWHQREQARFDNGTYKYVPWHNEFWAKKEHFCHVSTEDPTKIAFTPNNEMGIKDKQIRMRVGKYLRSFGRNFGYWIDKYRTLHFPPREVKFATTQDEIEQVYTNGPSSCMCHEASEFAGKIHPTRVYAGGDLAIAYMMDYEDSRVTARCLVWPNKKLYGRIYGDVLLLKKALEDLGYFVDMDNSDHSFNGARLLKIKSTETGQHIMPFLDFDYGVNDGGKYWLMSDCGNISGQTTNGILSSEEYRCYYCEERTASPVFVNDHAYCGECYDEYIWQCHSCGHEFEDDDHRTMCGDDPYCESCADRNLWRCDGCDDHFHDYEDQFIHEDQVYCEDCKPDEDEKDEEPSNE